MTEIQEVKWNMITNQLIKKIADQCGAELCGIASVERFKKAPSGFHPKAIYPPTRSVIVFARRIPDSGFSSRSSVPYTFLTTLTLNEVYQLTLRIVRELENLDVIGIPVPSEPYEYWDKRTKTGKGIYPSGMPVIWQEWVQSGRIIS